MIKTVKFNLARYFPEVSFGEKVQIFGVKSIRIGKGSCIGDDTWLNDCVRDDKVRLKIGKCVLIGRRSIVSSGGYLEIGDYTITGPNVYVSNVDHDYRNINVPIYLGSLTAGRNLVVEENCWLAFNSVVVGNVTVGRGSVIGANAVVVKDVPPFSVVVGNIGRIVKMFDPSVKKWVPVKTEDDKQRVLENREKKGLPSRSEYRAILAKANLKEVNSVVAGGGRHIP